MSDGASRPLEVALVENSNMLTRTETGYDMSAASTTNDPVSEPSDLAMTITESFFERPVLPTSVDTDADFFTMNKSPITIHSVTSSDGGSIKIMPDSNVFFHSKSDSPLDYSRRWHRHAQDVSLAAPGNRPHWHLPKADPSSSATPPSQFLGFYSSDHVNSSANSCHDLASLVDAPPGTIDGRHFASNSSSPPSVSSHSPFVIRRSVSEDESRGGIYSLNCHSAKVESSDPPTFSAISEMERFFSTENMKQSRPSVISTYSPLLDSVTTSSTIARHSSISSGNTHCMGSLSPVDTQHSSNVYHDEQSVHTNSEMCFVKLENSLFESHDASQSSSSTYVSSSNARPFPQECGNRFVEILNDTNHSAHGSGAHNLHSQRMETSVGQQLSPTFEDGSNFREMMVVLNGEKEQFHSSPQNFVRTTQASPKTFNHVQPLSTQNPIIMQNMFVPLSHGRRASLPGTDELFLNTVTTRSTSAYPGLPPKDAFPPSHLPIRQGHDRRRNIFHRSVRTAKDNGEKFKKRSDDHDIILENSYESMKNFWSKAKPMSLNQLYAEATGDHRTLAEKVNQQVL